MNSQEKIKAMRAALVRIINEGDNHSHSIAESALIASTADIEQAAKPKHSPLPESPAQPDTAKAIHYPECWDVAAYPTLESALSEIAAFKCSECTPAERNSRELYEFLRAMQCGEMTVSRGMELIDIWLAGNYRDDMLPPVGAQPMQPTYYVRHPDYSYSIAEPQPDAELKVQIAELERQIESARFDAATWKEAHSIAAENIGALRAQIAAQAEPSNIMINVAQRNLRAFLSKASFALNVDRDAALTCVDVLVQAITVQPSPANATVITTENSSEIITDMLMECVDRLGENPRVEIDPRAWENLLTYAPKPANQNAIVQAALEAAANVAGYQYIDNDTDEVIKNVNTSNRNTAIAIRAIDKQTILDGMSK